MIACWLPISRLSSNCIVVSPLSHSLAGCNILFNGMEDASGFWVKVGIAVPGNNEFLVQEVKKLRKKHSMPSTMKCDFMNQLGCVQVF